MNLFFFAKYVFVFNYWIFLQLSLVPYSDSDESFVDLNGLESLKEVEEETCVGKRGYRKQKRIPKRLQKVKKKNTSVLPNPCLKKKCPNSCHDKISEDERVRINEHFWGIGNKIRQKDWLSSCVKQVDIKRRYGESDRKKCSFNYFININNSSFKVCQKFLLKTLNISQTILISVIKYISSYKTCLENIKKPTAHNKSEEASISLVKSFIEQLPAVPSHYCRNKSTKLYLPQEFRNIKTVYQHYVEHLKTINKVNSQLSLRVFRNIFRNSFNLGFHLPKKDKCILCENYNNLDTESKKQLHSSEEYQIHLKDKEKCKQIFLEDQKLCKENPAYLCTSFDLQKVLNTPYGKSVTLFYSRKYSFYNESFYESGTRDGFCFLWGEKDGKRGCNEICTTVFQYLKLVDERKTQSIVHLYCDSCAGQNKNRAMLATLTYFVENSNFVTNIKITYLLPGHTMMPVDSIHSTIESFIRNRTIWAPSEWYTIISNARTNPRKYNCIELTNSDFKDWKTFSQALLPNSVKIQFTKLRSVTLEKNIPNITLKYGYFDESETINYDLDSIPRSRRNSEIVCEGPTQLYDDILNISSAKYKDLKTLCDRKTIPVKFQHEYLNLKWDGSVKDLLPETDQEDSI